METQTNEMESQVEEILSDLASEPLIDCFGDDVTKKDVVEAIEEYFKEDRPDLSDEEKKILLKEVVSKFNAYHFCGITPSSKDVSEGDTIDVIEEDFNNEYNFQSLADLDDDDSLFGTGDKDSMQNCYDTSVDVERLLRGDDILITGTKWNNWEEENNGLSCFWDDGIYVVRHFQNR
jgi:hypothetical protein